VIQAEECGQKNARKSETRKMNSPAPILLPTTPMHRQISRRHMQASAIPGDFGKRILENLKRKK
jgi:hypothetical protein